MNDKAANNSSVLVTGATGFIGSQMVDSFLKEEPACA